MKLLAPITVIIAAASAGRVYETKSLENFGNSLEHYQSGLEKRDQYSVQSDGHNRNYHKDQSSGEKAAKVLGLFFKNDGHAYKYAYETENGIKAEEVGDTSGKGTKAQGGYSYKGDDGKVYTVTYVADEHGFRPTGEHLPTPHPIPEAILKSLEQNAKEEASGIYDDGNYREHKQQADHQIESGHQAIAYAPSGADLAYHAQAPTYHTALDLLHTAPSAHGDINNQISSEHSSEYNHQASAGYSQSNLAYIAPSGGSGYYTAHGQGEGLGQHGLVEIGHGQHASSLQSGFYPVSGYALENSGHSISTSGSSGHIGSSYLPPSSHSG